jgi:hypothetical protein
MQKTKDIIAKSILSNKYWILESNGKKVGTIQAIDDGGFSLVKNQERKKYATIASLSAENNIFFDTKKIKNNGESSNLISNYPIDGKAYNVIWNVKQKFAAYTKNKKSKCHYCAGYFVVKFQNEWEVMFCPKLIMINRYEFKGPFKTKSEAEKVLNHGS